MDTATVQGPGSDVPDLPALTSSLAQLLGSPPFDVQSIEIVDRQIAPASSTFPCEIVTCRTKRNGQLRLYCKYAINYTHGDLDNRQGLVYEGTVYRRILQPIPVTVPVCYGVHSNSTTGDSWLVLEYLNDSLPLNDTADPASLVSQAACWLAAFHAVNEPRVSTPDVNFLVRYDATYYRGWSRRTLLFARDVAKQYPWLETVCGKYEKAVDCLVASPLTVVHGEFDSTNLLWRNGTLYPVDWESAAVAAPEIDLARLTWGWPVDVADACERAYQDAYWRSGPPSTFLQRLTVARVYLLLRFLGERPEWTIHESSSSLFAELREAAERLAVI